MTDPLFSPLQEAALHWQDSQPVCAQHDDVYFSRHNGLAETEYVFLEGNRLKQRWNTLDGNDFTLAETGFGTGLNFLAAQQLWLQQTASGTLHYLSAELCPLAKPHLQEALSLWPSLGNLSQALLDNYPNPLPGIHHIHLPQQRTVLTLLYGDATRMFSSLRVSDHPLFADSGLAKVDAWFLDGFAPAKNPELWNQQLLTIMAQLSKPNHTTFSTFTAAGVVKRGLKTAGFQVEKIPGYGSKRDMLRGQFSEADLIPNNPANETRQRHKKAQALPWHIPANSPKTPPQQVAVIGAGIAGCTTAYALAQRGLQVRLIDQHEKPAQEGSGNPQGILFPRLSLRMGLLSRFALAALNYALYYYQPIWQAARENPGLANMGDDCGVILLPENEKQLADYQTMAHLYPNSLVELLDNRQLQQQSGIALTQHHGLFFPRSGWINPQQVCSYLIDHPNIVMQQTLVKGLEHDSSTWQLKDDQQQTLCEADAVIITAANATRQFSQTGHLPLKPVRGQVTVAPTTTSSDALKTVLCGEGYLAPATGQQHTFGASYQLGDTSTEVTDADNQENLHRLAATDPALSELFDSLPAERLSGRAALRATTPDYLPIAGPVPDHDSFLSLYSPLRNNARADIPQLADYHTNLYTNCGHGSRGMTYAPFCAEVIASQICGQFPPLQQDLLCAIHPARFLVRGLKRNQL